MRISQAAWSQGAKKRTASAAADEEKVSASASAIGILKDDANTVQSKKEGRKEGEGMVGSAAFFGFSISEKKTLSREKR